MIIIRPERPSRLGEVEVTLRVWNLCYNILPLNNLIPLCILTIIMVINVVFERAKFPGMCSRNRFLISILLWPPFHLRPGEVFWVTLGFRFPMSTPLPFKAFLPTMPTPSSLSLLSEWYNFPKATPLDLFHSSERGWAFCFVFRWDWGVDGLLER